MLNQNDLATWYARLNLNDQARKIIEQVRSSEPTRRVGGGHSNVSGFYPSRKMGKTIQFESHRVELAAIYEMEHDPLTLEFYDQPPSIVLDYKSKDGRRVVVRHTPDFFVLRQDNSGWEEWKAEEDLTRLAEKSPNRYRQDAGCWRCPPGEAVANESGLYYRVRSRLRFIGAFSATFNSFKIIFVLMRAPCPPKLAPGLWRMRTPGRPQLWQTCSRKRRRSLQQTMSTF